MKTALLATTAAIGVAVASTPAQAEFELSFFTGTQSAPHSDVSGNDPTGLGAFDFNSGWDGESFKPAPYYGFRAMWWQNENLGYGTTFTHSKIVADSADQAANGFNRLEFTDGLNFLTANVFYRWPEAQRRWTPYVGAGLGVALPHVDIDTGTSRTFEYQYAGPTVQVNAGISYALNDRWSIFGEYQGNYTSIDVDLNGGGSLKTDVITNALNAGVSLRF
ncbi:lipid A oxidase [Actibacterium mucosum KCTC 23349]|uniref:Lipid A oxidase n=1 Tax=Actibacterium mucosum KCTC 23349 TaxID=1454373 RepID=A0A037ZN88_9RHOB|nr:outer membrane beta-barrel protein [Actibacterium mucosum]KAJ57115.1 lipid A oxidase [Actibacterium mucosum KCTC 23349]